jgi:hypothetical protein
VLLCSSGLTEGGDSVQSLSIHSERKVNRREGASYVPRADCSVTFDGGFLTRFAVSGAKLQAGAYASYYFVYFAFFTARTAISRRYG